MWVGVGVGLERVGIGVVVGLSVGVPVGVGVVVGIGVAVDVSVGAEVSLGAIGGDVVVDVEALRPDGCVDDVLNPRLPTMTTARAMITISPFHHRSLDCLIAGSFPRARLRAVGIVPRLDLPSSGCPWIWLAQLTTCGGRRCRRRRRLR